MIKKIKILEKEASMLEAGAKKRKHWMHKLDDFTSNFLDSLPDQLAFYGSETVIEKSWTNYIPETPSRFDEVLKQFGNQVLKNGINGAHSGHMGYIPGGGLFPSALGDFIAAITNKYAGVFFASPGAVAMEHGLTDWMGSLFGLPESTRGGTLTSGGSLANLLAVTTARDEKKIAAKNYPALVVYGTRQTHHCIDKALKIAGLAETKFRRIPMDDNYRMNTAVLNKEIQRDEQNGLFPFMLVGTAGTTDMGIMDPLKEQADVAREHNLWFHVDAAYGGFFALTEPLRPLFNGIEGADSIVVDPHKSLFLPFGTGAFLIRDKKKLFDSQHVIADYMQDSQDDRYEVSPADLSPELTRHYRGLRMWLPLKLFGLKPFRAALAEKHYLCRYAWNELQKIPRLETGPEPDLSITFFRYLPEHGNADDFNKKLVQQIRSDGRIFLSTTRIEGRFYIRIAILSFRTHLEEVQLAIELIKKQIEEIRGEEKM